jgi:hypothetical protein
MQEQKERGCEWEWFPFAPFVVCSGKSPREADASGQGEIRTLDTVAGMPVFETGAFSHSATCPEGSQEN